MSDHHAAESRRQHDGRRLITRPRGDRLAENPGLDRVLKHERALQVPGAVQSRRELKMSFEQCARGAEALKQIVGMRRMDEVSRRGAAGKSRGIGSRACSKYTETLW